MKAGQKKAIQAALAAPYHRLFIKEEDGGYSASIVELPGVYGSGDSIDKANEALEDGLRDWVALELQRGHEIPEPLDVEAFSGRLTFRIPPTLHYKAWVLAQLEGISLNRLLSDAVATQIGMLGRHQVVAPVYSGQQLSAGEIMLAQAAGMQGIIGPDHTGSVGSTKDVASY